MGWAGTAIVCSIGSGGILTSRALGQVLTNPETVSASDLNFVQISDTHIGFDKPANTNVIATFQQAISQINGLSAAPEFLLHTGDISHLAHADQFDTVEQMLKSAKGGKVFYVPGEHDILGDNGAQYLSRFGKGTQGNGWYSFDQKGIHYAHCRFCPHSSLGSLREVGLGYFRWSPSTGPPKAVWLNNRSERPHPPNGSENRRQHDVPHGALHCFSPARTRNCSKGRPDDGSGR
jgi:3',5'-cyclic AMP phosphodiesterase CpdA